MWFVRFESRKGVCSSEAVGGGGNHVCGGGDPLIAGGGPPRGRERSTLKAGRDGMGWAGLERRGARGGSFR